MSDVDNWGGSAYVGVGVTWEISVPSSLFYSKPPTALKKIKVRKRKDQWLLEVSGEGEISKWKTEFLGE